MRKNKIKKGTPTNPLSQEWEVISVGKLQNGAIVAFFKKPPRERVVGGLFVRNPRYLTDWYYHYEIMKWSRGRYGFRLYDARWKEFPKEVLKKAREIVNSSAPFLL